MHDNSRRRVAAVARHLQPPSQSGDAVQSSTVNGLAAQPTAAGIPASSYAKVHGEVSRDTAIWTQIPAVQRSTLQEVIYEKAIQEGIAKVTSALISVAQFCMSILVVAPVLSQV